MKRNLLVLSIGLSLTAGARAEERTHPWFVMAGLTLPQPVGQGETSSGVYSFAPGGRTLGGLLGAGRFVAHRVSVELELSTTGVMSEREGLRYFTTITEERQDRVATLAIRVHLRRDHGIGLEPVAGMVLVQRRAWSQREYLSGVDLSRPPTIEPREREDLPLAAGWMVGLEVRLGTARVALVPSLRVQAAGTNDDPVSHYDGAGIPLWTFRPGVTLRVAF
jgi:hypothetical protein